ncbi:phospholipase A2-like isoform X2 [Bombus impatiens]|uniref:Phospholipase A2 n=1 Tax=Bombus impatiens TaxID=132113 RepID=A0A6P8M0N2_BOMIM|nr:phospholipase A2-like isoform X2 [Bombus impatiens]
MRVLGLSCVFALWLSSHVSVRALQPIMFRNPVPFSATEIKDGLSERWIPSYNYTRIFPDTLWCGIGNIASGPNQLGRLKSTDACCRTHDMCPDVIEAYKKKHGLTNPAFYSRLSCDCDEKFRQCLKKSTDEISANLVGFGYFTLLRTQCFRVDYPIVDCIERSWFLRRCKKYRFDTKGQKKYQWFDLLEY